jgi:hypothetical protein
MADASTFRYFFGAYGTKKRPAKASLHLVK